ncbi:uncharacterized protein LOC124456131 [Xenia sp. Carnegie-2017]|uniref:uncharacterized protein LOC124456131 n=1 Tax=Xenia sp. Carnegie-2017 TaxID=2897299 RepID=UPI001F04A187|nr:uncharacterized protein LOC124456131 [Xenia sp. Carnegie-2017]
MYQFGKKFRRSNEFFYINVDRKGNTQKDDANSSVSYDSQFFDQEIELGELNEQSEDIANSYDKRQELTTKTQDFEDIFTKQSISIIIEESKQPCQHSQVVLSYTLYCLPLVIFLMYYKLTICLVIAYA